MMKILGIAAEYNPFHNGHKFHIEESKKVTGADHVVAVMSGNFVQRGEPAIADKWSRAEIAVRNGADLVIELPVLYACNGGARFAEGAVSILENLGCISFMSFGSEAGDIELLSSLSEEKISFHDRDKTYAQNMGDAFSKAGVSSDANNILAVEYLRRLSGTDITPVTIRRCDSGYASETITGSFASASKIRDMLLNGESAAALCPEVPEQCSPFSDDIKDRLFCMTASEMYRRPGAVLDSVPSAGEGIGNRIKNEIRRAQSFDELVDIIRAGRYSRARIRRALIQILLGAYDVSLRPSYARVLAFNRKGAEMLRYIKKNETLSPGFQIINNMNKEDVTEVTDILRFDILASDMYNLLMSGNMFEESDMIRTPRMVGK